MSNSVRLVAFSGPMGCGKSEAIKALAALNSSRWVPLVKFAQPLYDIQEAVYERISTVYRRPIDFVKDRKLLQWLGTDWGRNIISENLWVDIWKAEVKNLFALNSECIVVCDDCRFDNEAKVVKDMGGLIIKIMSDRTAERINVGAGFVNHASEAGINPKYVDAVIENNGSLEHYKNSLVDLYRRLGVTSDSGEYHSL